MADIEDDALLGYDVLNSADLLLTKMWWFSRVKRYRVGELVFQRRVIVYIVWLLQESRTIGISTKLGKRYDGPYVIVKMFSPVNFVIQMNPEGRSVLVHHDKVKMYNRTNISKWAYRIAKRILKRQYIVDYQILG